MLERLSRSWELVGASAALLRHDRKLLVFPLISSVAMLLLVAAFALPLFGADAIDRLTSEEDLSSRGYLVAFLFYLIAYFIVIYFNVALVGCAMMRMEGSTPSVGDGLRLAASKAPVIFAYAFIDATVGIVLRAIMERVGWLGALVVAIVGAAWTLATYLVIPVLVANDVGPLRAIGDSTELMKQTWGESVIGGASIALGFVGIYFIIITIATLLVAVAVALKLGALAAFVMVMCALAIGLTVLVHSALSGIYAAVLYRFATTGESTPGFDGMLLEQAFVATDLK